MKLTSGILMAGMALGTAWAQNPDIIENTRNTMKAVVIKKEIDSNAALAATQSNPPTTSTPSHAAPSTNPSTSPSAKPARTSAATRASSAKVSVKSATAAKKPVTHIAAKSPMKPKPATESKPAESNQQVAVEDQKMPGDAKKDDAKAINITGKRDPFISPVVNRSMLGSGCSTGKKCLAIDQIALKGVVRADSGMIAVVVNALNKAYFLHENDPVFDGYVMKITGDSIIFKETVQDKVGKNFTREVTKKITASSV